MKKVKVFVISTTQQFHTSPFEEFCVLFLPDEARPLHHGLEALPFDRPKLAVVDGGDGGGALTIVQDGKFAEHFRA